VSMISVKHLDIAAIGDEDLVSGLRLAGVSRYYIVRSEANAVEDVRKTLSELIGDPSVGIVAVQEEYAKHVEDLAAQVRESKKITPVIIEVPSKFGTRYQNIKEYYKAFIRKSVGFEVEI